MGQEYKNIAIIGAGASGCICTYYLLKQGFQVTIFDYSSPLRTILPTGGGRCNLAYAEYDFRELAKNYPRGEKFLYSVFSRFSTSDTISLFEDLGIKTYVQNDGRIFPESNSSKEVREKILNKIKSAKMIKENVLDVIPLDKEFEIKTSKAEYLFTDVVIATGGNRVGTYFSSIGHNIIQPKPSLIGLNSDIKNLSGVVLNDVYSKDINETGNILFTHFGISGPLVYKISSIKAREDFPYTLTFDLCPNLGNLQLTLDKNSHKLMKNILSEYFPHRFSEFISSDTAEKKGFEINGKERDLIEEKIHNFNVTITGTNKGEETVTSGGYDLNQINPKTMESKLHDNIYIIGEALDIDGFCGGFNLQNAWSTAFVAANGIINKKG